MQNKPPRDRHPPRDARSGALRLIEAVLETHQPLTDLTAASGPLARLAPPARAEAQRLALACLRRIAPIDSALAPLLRRPPEPALRMILRLGAAEMHLSPDAAHAIVNACVDLARALPGGAGKSGFVNAVLRRLAAEPARLASLTPQRLPDVLRTPMVAAWGEATVTACEAVQARDDVPLDITLRDPSEAPLWAQRLGAEILPTGSLRRARAGQVSALPGYAEGAWWVQDAAAALPVQCLAQAVGDLGQMRILDLCAAPGGKTMQLAALGADVTALDVSAPRTERLCQNLARTSLRAHTIVADALHWQPPPQGGFDAILLDAPCSASGTIRRHPDLPFLRTAADVTLLCDLQRALIDRAVGWLRPGSVILYATCSVLPAEGEAQIAAALDRHCSLEVQPLALPPGLPDRVLSAQGALRVLPSDWAARGGIDGFYIACLRKV